jgi:1,4-dihydroxy-2-naphthoate octaprenyltransferase
MTRPRWLPAAVVASIVAGVAFAFWVFGTIAG